MFDRIGKILKDVLVFAVLVLSCVGIMHLCSCPDKGYTVGTEETIDTVYVNTSDTITKYVPKYIKEYISYNDTIYVDNEITIIKPSLFTRQDTLNLIDSYFSKRIYVDSLETEYGYVIVEDELWKNSIYSRKYCYDFSVPQINKTVTKTIIEKPKRFNLFAGLNGNIAVGQEDYDVYNNELLMPQGYVGGQYRIGDYHYIKAEVDAFRKDVRVGYSFVNNRISLDTEYSIQYTTINGGLKFYIIK